MEQRSRDLRERLIDRRNQDRTKHTSHHDLRSRSRSTEGSRDSDEDEARRPWHRRSTPERHRRDQHSPPARRRNRKASDDSARRSSSGRVPFVKESDPVILARRQKQLDYGKNTLCYQEYIKTVPKQKRQPFHPRTPVKLRQSSRRRWDSAVKNWRIHLHYWNDPVKLAQLRARDTESETSEQAATETPELVPKSDCSASPAPVQSADGHCPESQAASGRSADLSVVKQEPGTDCSGAATGEEPTVTVKEEPKVTIKEEPEDYHDDLYEADPQEEPSYREAERSFYLEEHANDDHVDWADDLEGLASELAS